MTSSDPDDSDAVGAPPAPAAVRDFLIAEARRQGFHRAAVIPIEAPLRYRAYRDWIARDMHGSMAYMAAPEHIESRADIAHLAENARTLVVVALAYDHREVAPEVADDGAIRGFVARYARGRDYHGVLKRRLYALADALSQYLGRAVSARPCTDSAPVLEREYAERAGIGFIAKNTMLIAPGLGSYTVLGELLLDVDTPPAASERPRSRCGSCRACLDACPTQAFDDAYLLDARRCISYLTIEHQGAIERELRPLMGTMIFGCDICQEVCPFNARAPARNPPDPDLLPRDAERGAPDLLQLLALGANQRRRYVEGTPLRRANRQKLMRNLCVALGNAGDARAVAPLAEVLEQDRSPLVRGHAAWALGRLGARDALERVLATETDDTVLRELRLALRELADPTESRSEPGPEPG